MFSELEIIEKRLPICNSCQFKRMGICMKCGCIINAKVRIASSKCPVGKW